MGKIQDIVNNIKDPIERDCFIYGTAFQYDLFGFKIRLNPMKIQTWIGQDAKRVFSNAYWRKKYRHEKTRAGILEKAAQNLNADKVFAKIHYKKNVDAKKARWLVVGKDVYPTLFSDLNIKFQIKTKRLKNKNIKTFCGLKIKYDEKILGWHVR